MRHKEKDRYIPALSFDFLTPLYDPVVKLTTREKAFKSKLLDQINLHPCDRVLDLGCGTATLTIALKQSCPQAEVVGLDGDAKILKLARCKIEKAGVEIALDEGMSYKMPYADDYFNSVVSSLFFHHLTPEGKEKTLAEVFRVLKPSGFLHVADWGKPSNILMKVASMPIGWLDGATTKDSFQGILPELMTKAGFSEVVEITNYNSVFGTIRLNKGKKY